MGGERSESEDSACKRCKENINAVTLDTHTRCLIREFLAIQFDSDRSDSAVYLSMFAPLTFPSFL